MPRRRLTAQDAFVGVRRSPAQEGAPAPLPPEEPTAVRKEPKARSPAPEEAPVVTKPSRPKPRKRAPAGDRELRAALREAQQAAAARAAVERLTLYLPADLSELLASLWEEVREVSQVKVGKSLLAAAALRIVLSDAELRARAAADALRDKLGGGPTPASG